MASIGDNLFSVLSKMPLLLQYYALLLPLAMSMVAVVDSGKRLPSVHWNASNPMFKKTNNDHIINVNLGDSIDIICPIYSTNSDSRHWKYYVIYMVNETEYETCIINDTTKVTFILNCSDPTAIPPPVYTLLIRDFQSIPGNPDFAYGKSYYFISTSRGARHEINNQYHGVCYENNMKMMLNVCCSTNQTVTQKPTTGNNNNNNGGATSRPTTTTRTTTTTTRTTTNTKTTQKLLYPKTDGDKHPSGDNLLDEKVIHANGPKNVGLISDNSVSAIAVSFSSMLVTLATSLYLVCCR